MTAAGFHAEFILNGVTHNSFICPCYEIPLTAVNIDKAEFVITTFFSIRWYPFITVDTPCIELPKRPRYLLELL